MMDAIQLPDLLFTGATNRFEPYAPACHLSNRTDVSSLSTLELSRAASWVFGVVRRLEALDRLPAGWDSYGGRTLNPEARRLTVQTIHLLDKEDLPVPNVALGSRGTIQLEWRFGGKELDIDVGSEDDIEYVKYDCQGNVQEGRTELNSPAELSYLARWLMHG